MGQFSWVVEGEAIYSSAPYQTVYMRDDRDNVWVESKYEGYGVFGGKDYYALVAQMNQRTEDNRLGVNSDLRQLGIDLVYNNNPYGSSAKAMKMGVKLPTLSFDKDKLWIDLPALEGDPGQGHRPHPDEDDDEHFPGY